MSFASIRASQITELADVYGVGQDEAKECLILHKWKMQDAHEDLFQRQVEEEYAKTSDGGAKKRKLDSPAKTNKPSSSPSSSKGKEPEIITEVKVPDYLAPETFTILSWNLDGLDMTQVELRTNTVLDIVEKENYSILFFQELIPSSFAIIEKRLISKYVKVLGKEINLSRIDYFNATFLRRDHIIYDDHFTIPFPNSQMGRKLLVTRAHTGSVKLALLNTHLESCKESSEERKNQLKTCFGLCPSFPEQYNIIFGGDLNLRDKEVGARKPSDMFDIWEAFDGNENVRFTWDLAKNTNKYMPNNVKPRARFDRFYFRNSEPMQLNFEYFGLIGQKKVSGTQLFPSDHWGIVSRFRLEPEARLPPATNPDSSRSSALSQLLKEKELSTSSPPSKKTRKESSPTQESCQQQ